MFSHLDEGEESPSPAADVEEGRGLGVLVRQGAPYTQDRPPAHGIAHTPHLDAGHRSVAMPREGRAGRIEPRSASFLKPAIARDIPVSEA